MTKAAESADEVFSRYPWFHQDEFLNGSTFPWRQSRGNFGNILSGEASVSIRPDEYADRRYQEALAEVPELAGESELGAKQFKCRISSSRASCRSCSTVKTA